MRQLRTILAGVIFTMLAVGLAYAMPKAIQATAHDFEEELGAGGQTPTANVPGHTPTARGDKKRDGEENGSRPDNHGAAVSTAAHCDVKGRAHGELVRSIAKDEDATVADAEAACAAAMDAAAAGSTRTRPANPGNSDHRARPAKPAKPQKPDKPEKPDQAAAPDTQPGNGKAKGKS